MNTAVIITAIICFTILAMAIISEIGNTVRDIKSNKREDRSNEET